MQNPFFIIDQRLSNIEQLLLDIKHSCYQVQETPQKGRLNIDELEEYTGIPKNSLYGMVSRGEIPCSKPGKKLIFIKSEIDTWLYDNRKKTASEVASEADEFLESRKTTTKHRTK